MLANHPPLRQLVTQEGSRRANGGRETELSMCVSRTPALLPLTVDCSVTVMVEYS